jgi:hypothetical protein
MGRVEVAKVISFAIEFALFDIRLVIAGIGIGLSAIGLNSP